MYDKKRLASHLEDIKRALKDSEMDFDDKELRDEFERYLYTYQIPLGEAKRSVVRKYKGDPDLLSFGVDKNLGDLKANEASVNILVRIITINHKTVEIDGKKRDIVYGLLGDGTRTLPYTAWTQFSVKRGDVVYITNVAVKEWNNRPEISINKRSVVNKRDPSELPTYIGSSNPHPVQVKDIRDKANNLVITLRILELSSREVNTKDGKKTVFNGIGGDETGLIKITTWADLELDIGSVYTLKGGYAKEYNGSPQVVFDERTEVEKVEDKELPDEETLSIPITHTIYELASRSGAMNVRVKGVVLDVKPGSGLIFRCPDCSRSLKKGACMLHGSQEGIPDLRIKGVLDDGTSACSFIAGKDITEGVLGMDLEEAKDIAKSKMNYEIIRDRLVDSLVARPIVAEGDVFIDEFGLHMNVKSLGRSVRNVKADAQTLLDSLEVPA